MQSTGRDGPLRRRALVGGLWIAFQNIYGTAGSAVAFVVLARLIDPAKFGLAALAQVVITIVTLIANLGVTPSMMRVPELSEERLNTGFWLGLAISVLLCGVVEVTASLLAAWLHTPALALILRVVAVTIPVTAIGSVPTVLLSRQLQMRPQAVRQVVGVTIATTGAIAMAIAGFGVWSLVFQDFGTVATDSIILWMMISWRPRMRFSIAEARGLLGFGYQVTLTQLVNQSQDRIAQLLVGRILGTTALGFWVVATQISTMTMKMFASTMNAVALPAFSIVQDDSERLERAIRHTVRICATVVLPGMGALAALAPVLIPFLFGQRWHTTADIAQITCITAALGAIQYLDGNIWWALGKARVELLLVCVIMVVHVATVWGFARYGVVAVALALLGRTLLTTATRATVLRRIGGIPFACYRDVPAIAACSAMMYGAMRAVGMAMGGDAALLVIVSEFMVGVVVYLAAAVVLQRSTLRELRADVVNIMNQRSA